MKSLKLIESRNIDNDVAETLLPTLSNKEMNEVTGGVECGKEYTDGPIVCGKKYTFAPCLQKLYCGKDFTDGITVCDEGYLTFPSIDKKF